MRRNINLFKKNPIYNTLVSCALHNITNSFTPKFFIYISNNSFAKVFSNSSSEDATNSSCTTGYNNKLAIHFYHIGC